MKRVSFVILLLAALVVMPAQAQFRFGVKGGVNLEQLRLERNIPDLIQSNSEIGFQVGPVIEFLVPVIGLGFDAAVMYSQHGLTFFDSGSNDYFDFTNGYVDLPINLKWRLSLGPLGFFVTAGPGFSFNVMQSDDVEVFGYKYSGYGLNCSDIMYTANLGAGVELFHAIQFSGQYSYGISDNWQYDVVHPHLWSTQSGLWQFNLAIFF